MLPNIFAIVSRICGFWPWEGAEYFTEDVVLDLPGESFELIAMCIWSGPEV